MQMYNQTSPDKQSDEMHKVGNIFMKVTNTLYVMTHVFKQKFSKVSIELDKKL